MQSHENEHINKDRFADSAGVPWQGRSFQANSYADDDGSANPALIEAIGQFQAGEITADKVVDQVRQSRLLVPLIAQLGESELGAHGHVVDKSAELSIVTVEGPDGQTVMPVFSSMAAMQKWNPEARPVPSEPVKVALAAASELTNRIVLDPGSETEFVIRRPAIAAIAQSLVWQPPEQLPQVHAAFSASIADEPDVFAFALMSGDPKSVLAAPELVVLLRIRTGLIKEHVELILSRITKRWSESEPLARFVDSMTIKLVPAQK
ncbi:MAG: hypothetical protein RLZZ229_602 [Actinomycetota bacterium]|jgi:hypothetical protein